MRIVVIEDEIRIREGIGRLLHKLDESYELAGTAENGRQGLALIQDVKPDVVITDIRMPVMDGLEMLTEAVAGGFEGKAVILSAYTEFDYARQAIRLGVSEYLIKPVVVNELTQILIRIKQQIEEEGRQKSLITRPDQLFSSLLWSSLTLDENKVQYIKEKLGIRMQEPVSGICIYMGRHFKEQKEKIKRELAEVLVTLSPAGHCFLDSEREQMLYLFLYGYEKAQNPERRFQTWLLNQHREQSFPMSAGWVEAKELGAVKASVDLLQRHMEWSITLGTEVLIVWPKINKLQTIPCVYPIEIENRMKGAVCAARQDKIEQLMEAFHTWFQNGAVYTPHEIKECYVRFLWAVMNISKEIGLLETEKIQQQKLLEQVMSARLSEELREAAQMLLDCLTEQEEEAAVHLTVKKAQAMIHEYYQTGIMLEEIADKLNITPEYLGNQFHKEMGVTFSAYMKNYRIGKAKELLLKTPLKLYEIAQKVGYADAKYFSRVFREATGQLPADYRKTHR